MANFIAGVVVGAPNAVESRLLICSQRGNEVGKSSRTDFRLLTSAATWRRAARTLALVHRTIDRSTFQRSHRGRLLPKCLTLCLLCFLLFRISAVSRTLRDLRHHEGLPVFPLRKCVSLVRMIVDEPFLLRIEADPGPKHGGRRIQANFVFAQILAAALECIRE